MTNPRQAAHALRASLATLCIALGAAGAAHAQSEPEIVAVSRLNAPAAPVGMRPQCTTGDGDTCPVIQYGGFTTWAFTYNDSRSAYGLVSYDAKGAVVRNVQLDGARYPYKITSDPVARTVSIWGQSDGRIDVPWSDLPYAADAASAAEPPQPPQIRHEPANAHPPIPAGLGESCSTRADGVSKTCPVIHYRGYRTWIYSFNDNSHAFGIVSYDRAGAVVQNLTREGARYVSEVDSDHRSQQIRIFGQGGRYVTLQWSELPQ